MRTLTKNEAACVDIAVKSSEPYSLVELTPTILNKGYWDATQQVRGFLEKQQVHSYLDQSQGPEYKVVIPGSIVTNTGATVDTRVSMYRPKTKNGDPRMWFYGMHTHASSGDVLMLLFRHNQLISVDISQTEHSVLRDIKFKGTQLFPKALAHDLVRAELIEDLREISAQGFIEVQRAGSTGVGHLLESLLGIEANSFETPDYKGLIELKAKRVNSRVSNTLFAKVPNWKISPLKSSADILDNFGYKRMNSKGQKVVSLNCSVEMDRPNSQGLFFEIDDLYGSLTEKSLNSDFPVVARWGLPELLEKLSEKHRATMWVDAISRHEHGREMIHFVKATYTSHPVLEQFVPMIRDRSIYMDHLTTRIVGETKVSEKGPLFKIRPNDLNKLFPESFSFDLVHN